MNQIEQHSPVKAGNSGAAQPVSSPIVVVQAHEPPFGLRSVAMFEFGKGILFFLFGLSALSFVHGDVAMAANSLLLHLHLDPTWRLSQMFLEQSSRWSPAQVRNLGIFAMFLSVLRGVESVGLWHEKHWAEWFAVISSALYMPLEIYHLIHHYIVAHRISWVGVVVLGVNVAIVVYLWRLLERDYRKEREAKAG